MPLPDSVPDAASPHSAAGHGLPPEIVDLDETSVALYAAFRRALHMHRQFMARSLSDADLHPGQSVCLSALAREEGMTQRTLAEAMHIAPPTLSRMLTSLEKSGLIERRDDETDQRLTRIYLTAAGREVSGRIRRALADHIPAAIAALTLDERRELARLLEKLTASIASSSRDDSAGERGHAGGGAQP